MTVYDRLAPGFDRRRALPDGAARAIRTAVLSRLPTHPRVLDLGCGAGRIGWPFAAAGDDYIAADLSLGMLLAFAARGLSPPPCLTQTDGTALPFRGEAFDGVLLVQVLSGIAAWHALLAEVMRVLRPGGTLFVGQSHAPDDGLDARLKQRLAEILDGLGEHPYRGQSRDDAFCWLDRHANVTVLEAAHWPVSRTPRQFAERHGSGARFSALPSGIQAAAMNRLTAWAGETFGGLDTPVDEVQRFELRIYRFREKATI